MEVQVFGASHSRRAFIGGLTASAFLSVFGFEARAGERRLRFGVISDVHVSKGLDGRRSGGEARFRKVLERFRDSDVDAVMIAGDLTENGVDDEMKLVADTWFSVFPDDRMPDGRKIVRLFTTGNHDFGGYVYSTRSNPELRDRMRARSMEADPAGFWERYWHEPYAEKFVKTVKGYTFVFSHQGRWNGLSAYLSGLKLNPEKPFFYCQHVHPMDTVYAIPCSCSEASVTDALSGYSNAIVFSGHSHRPLNDPSSVWQGAFTSIATGAVSQLFLGGEVPHENYRMKRKKGTGAERRVEEMPVMRTADGAVSTLVDVYDDRLVLETTSVEYGFKVRENVVIPLPACRDAASSPLRFVPRRETDLPPKFPAGAVVEVLNPARPGKNREGRESLQTIISFPRAEARSGGLRDYEIVVERQVEGKWTPVCTRRIFARWLYFPEERARALMAKDGREQCVVSRALLPQNETLRYRVTPFDYWGKGGEPIYRCLSGRDIC